MKKFYLFLIATCLSLSSLFAQALVAEQGMKSIPDVNVVGGRNNAPQASYSYHFSFDEDGSIETWCFFKGSRRGLTSLTLIDIIWLPLPNDENVQLQFSMSYGSSVGQTKYGQILSPPAGTYTIVTSSSNMDASSKMWAGGDLSYGEVTSGTGVGYYYNVVADDLSQSGDIYTTGYADSWISYDGSSSTNFKSGSFIVEPGRHGYPYIYSKSLIDVKNNSLDITINDSRNLTTTYISAETIPNQEEMTVTLLGDDGNGNQMKFVFNVSDFNENGSVPAGIYTVGTDVSGMVYDLDGFTSWQLSRGTVTIAYDSYGRLTMSVSSLYGLSNGEEYSLNLSMNGINVSSVACPEVVYFISNGDFCASNFISEGTNIVVYHLGWFKDGDTSKRPGLQIPFCFSKSDIRYVNGKVVPPDGIYPFHPGNHFITTLTNSSGYSTEAEVTSVNNNTAAGYQWILLEDDQFNRISAKSSYIDESDTRYYLNSGYVTISTQSDGVHIVVEANGGTDPEGVMDLPFKFIIQPNSAGYKFDVSEIVGEGTVIKTPEQCLYQEGSQIILTPTPADGWTFNNWTGECTDNIADNGDGTFTFTVPASDCSLIANFVEESGHTLRWDFNGGETSSTETEYTHGTNIETGEFIKAPADPTREGYTFAGWLNSITGQIEFADGDYLTSTIEMPAEDLTFTAQWTEIPHNYIITFQDTEADGGYEWDSKEFTSGETPIYGGTEIPSKDADDQYTYEFVGWTDGENEYLTGTDLPAVTGEATYYAVYTSTKVQYTLTWDFNGGTTASVEEDYTHGLIDWGTAIIAPENPTMQGYTFTGWDAESVAAEMPTQDLTYTAQWEANTYTVHFDKNNDFYSADGAITGEMEDQLFTYDAEDVALTANAYDWAGHTFQGWATATDGEKVYEDGEAVSNLTAEQNGEVVLYAVWDINEYTITFQDAETDGGYVWGSDDFAYGTVPAYNGELIPSKEADEQYTYQFAGWKDAAGIEYPIGTYLPAVEGEATYYAVYSATKVSYELVWDVNGGDELTGDYTQGTVEWGTDIIAPAAPTREGYTFTGWMNGNTNEIELPAEETNIMPFAMPVDGLTYAAQWEANVYYVRFFDNGEYYNAAGTIEGTMPDQTFYYDEGQYLQANAFTWEGHTFQGWATTADGEVVYGDVEDITDNLTSVKDAVIELYAVWKTDTYTITFKNSMGDDDRVWWSGELAYGVTPVYEGETPVKAADADYTYTFAGWMVNLEEQYPIGTDLPKVTEDATYIAMYTQEETQFAVRFVNPDGSELQRYELPIGAVPVYDGVPTQANEGDEYNYYVFTFTGWVDEADNTYGVNATLPAVTGEITYTAQYSKQLFINLQEQMDDDYYTDFSDKYNGERATTATLVRQFDQGKWATLCLPFNVNAAVLTSSGLKSRIYEFKYTKGDAENGFTLYFAQANKLDAGKGYIVNANAVLAQKTQFVFPNVVVNTNADIQSGFDITTLEGYNSQGNIYLVGTLRQGKVLGDDGSGIYYMGLSSNKIKLANSTTGTVVRAYRGIFRSTERIQVPRVRIVAESEDGEIVDELEVLDGEIMEANAPYKYVQDGILYIVRDGVRYTAEGQRID